jgi:D-proline reductase (dithiol) PrdB
MADSLDEQRAALREWFGLERVQEALGQKDWRKAFAGYHRLNLEELPVPWAPAPSDISAARIMVIGSGGLYAQGQTPFDAGNPYGDTTWRAFSSDLDLASTSIAHEHYGNGAAEQDRNAVYPLDRLRALAANGEIGGLTDWHFSFMGYQPDWSTIMDTFAPQLAELVATQHPDAAILVPV